MSVGGENGSERLERERVDLEDVVCGDRRLLLRMAEPEGMWLEVWRHLDSHVPPRIRVTLSLGQLKVAVCELSVNEADELRRALGWMLNGLRVPSGTPTGA